MKNVYLILAAIIVSMLPGIMKAQNIFPANGSTGIGTATPDVSSILEVKSTTKGMLIPRMTKTQRDAIAFPAVGLMIYQTNSSPGFYYFDGAWKPVTPAAANRSLSNLSGPTAVNVDVVPDLPGVRNLGSLDTAWHGLSVQNIYIGGNRFISSPTPDNTFVGSGSGLQLTTGNRNTGVGNYVLFSNTTGDDNTAMGNFSLESNIGGLQNSALGSYALKANTAGSWNAAVGSSALQANTIGNNNAALGSFSLSQNTSGDANTASGAYSLYSNSTGNYNSAQGLEALYSNTTGYDNSALGVDALYSNTTGNNNSAVGVNSLYTNTTGSDNTAVGKGALFSSKIGNYNTAVGSQALLDNLGSFNTATGYGVLYDNTASYNTGNGYQALYYNTTGSQNTAIGAYALQGNNTGNYNTAGGRYALIKNGDGYENTAFGASAGANAVSNTYTSFFGYDANQAANTTFFNAMALGSSSRITANNQVRIGNSSVTSIGGYTNWTNISDGRFKKNIKENVPGLAFINKLKPVTYNLDITDLRKFLGEDVSYDKDGKKVSTELDEKAKQEIQKKEAIFQTGFVAQDVEKAAKELGYDFSGVDKPQNDNSPYGLRYSEFVVPLVKAVQELSKQNDDLKDENKELKARLDKIEAMIFANGKQTSDISNQQKISLQQTPKLEQNQPNPTTQTTVIKYFLPEQSTKAAIRITTAAGQEIRSINLPAKGSGQITLQTNNLSAGSYFYSLIVDGQTADTKRMIIAH